MKMRTLSIRLLAIILVVASFMTLSACSAADENESGSGSGSDSNSGSNGGTSIKAEDLTPSAGLTFSLTTDKKGYQVQSASKCKDEQVVIPSTYTGTDGKTLPVTAISGTAFKANKTAVTVYIPDSVTKITMGAFTESKSLTTVIMGAGVVEIGNKAFENCKALKNVQFGANVKKIGSYAFAGCESLEEVKLPDATESIGEACFQRCSQLRGIFFGSKIKSFGKFAFYFCKGVSLVKYNGSVKDWKKLKIDVSVFLSVTITKDVECLDGKAKLPSLEGQNDSLG